MSYSTDLVGPAFSTLLVVLLAMMVFTTYILARRPLLLNLREIYFLHNIAFTRAWHLIIAGMTMFVMARVILEGERLQVLEAPAGIADLFLLIFTVLVLIAFMQLLIVFQHYLPRLGAPDSDVAANVHTQVRDAVLQQDDDESWALEMSVAEDIYRGRPTLGPHVHLSHYRGVVLSMTRYLEHRFGQLGDALLYTVGRQTGRSAAQHMLTEHGSRDAALDHFLLEMRTALVGLPSIVERSPQRVRIRFDECALCSGIKPSQHPACHYLTGLMRGLFEVLHGPGVRAHETECGAKGDAGCIIEVTMPQPTGPSTMA